MTATATSAANPPASSAERPPRAAATLVVVRDASGGGIEVLLSRRAERGDHNSGAWVFPGGVVDAGDRAAHVCAIGLDDASASAQLGVPEGGLDFYVAAVRECFEESGLLFACDADGQLVTLDDDEPVATTAATPAATTSGAAIGEWRGPLHRGERSLVEFCAATGLRLAIDRLAYLSHWLTPPGRAKRFDTRFFIAAAPPAQTGAHDGTEQLEQLWLRPADALARSVALKLMTPTHATLALIAKHDDVAALLAWARAPREVPLVMPRVGSGSTGMRPVLPTELAWAELGRLDPAGHGKACYDIQPGVAVRLSPRLIRVTANNGSVMTGPGTNAYLVGGGAENEWAVIDPGPLDAAHVDAIVAAAPGAIRWIFATHTHTDHSPAVAPLAARTGAKIFGRVTAHEQWQDKSFAPDQHLAGGERFTLPGDTTLHVIHTPGHASNHLCYLLEEEKLLFTGDHVMQASTVVINPPDGDMSAYVASLRSLLALELDWLAPGHGFLMAEPRRAMEGIIAHRLKREAKVVGVMRAVGAATIDALLPQVYDDVNERLWPVARRSLLAHLLKLRDDATAMEADGRWALVGEAV